MYRQRGDDVYFIANDEGLPGLLAAQPDGHITGYLCRGNACGPPITDLRALKQALHDESTSRGKGSATNADAFEG